MIVTSGNPRRKNRDVVRVEGHEVGAISGRKLAERLLEAKEGGRMRRRKPNPVRQWNSEQAKAISAGARHVETRSADRPMFGAAVALPRRNIFPVQAEMA